MLRSLIAGLFTSVLVLAPVSEQAQDKAPLGKFLDDEDNSFREASVFDDVEPVITASPQTPVSFQLPADTAVRDFEVSPIGDEVAVIVEDDAGRQHIGFWRFGATSFARMIDVPAGTKLTGLTWHPQGNRLFFLATQGSNTTILKLDSGSAGFAPSTLFVSDKPLRRIVAGPRPFSIGGTKAYRIFFGQKLANGKFALRTVSDTGKVLYTVVGPQPDAAFKGRDPEESPRTTIASSALPVGFHPAGNILIWEDGEKCLRRTSYKLNNWGGTERDGHGCGGGFVAYTPNGAATLEWRPTCPDFMSAGCSMGPKGRYWEIICWNRFPLRRLMARAWLP